MTLTEFLLARIAECEADAGYIHDARCGSITYDYGGVAMGPCNCGVPTRVLAECAAKRAIVDRHLACERENAQYAADSHAYEAWAEAANRDPEDPETGAQFRRAHSKPPPRTTAPFETDGLRVVVALFVQPYVNHPDFDPAWRMP